jgi:outer membrane protein TolC
MNKLFSAGALVALLSTGARADGPDSAPAPRKITFEDAVSIAVHEAPAVAVAGEKAGVAEEKQRHDHAHRLPTLSVHDDMHQWTKAYEIPFGGTTFKVYDALTNTVSVSLSVPVTGQLYLNELLDGRELDTDAAHRDVEVAQLDAASKAAEAYVHVLAKRAAADVAHKTVTQIEGQLERAQKLRAADTYNDIDVLRFKSAKAAADRAALKADTDASTALAAFTVTLGLRDGDPIDVVDDLPSQMPPMAMTIAQAQDRALSSRPEVHASRDRLEAAHHYERASYAGYVPDVRAEAVYLHNTGFYPFQPDNAGFLGVTLQWNVWDWGASASQVAQAKHDEQAIKILDDEVSNNVRLDVRTRWLNAKAAFDGLASADTQQQAAEEAYRLQNVRFEASAATTTDVLDAETDVARARLAAADARYDYLLALIAMSRAVGDLPATTAVGAPSGH